MRLAHRLFGVAFFAFVVGCGSASGVDQPVIVNNEAGPDSELYDEDASVELDAEEFDVQWGDTGPEEEDASVVADSGGAADAPPATDTAPPPIAGPKLKVMTFNIRVGTAADGPNHWDLRKGLVYNVLKNEDADIVGLQEDLQFQVNAIMDNVPGYKRVGVGARDGKASGEFCAILYKSSLFTLKDSGTFWLSNTPNIPGSRSWGNEHPRTVTWVELAMKDTGYPLFFYNTHFDHVSQNSRENSGKLLMATIAKRKPKADFFVVGDLNAREDNPVIRFFRDGIKLDGVDNPIKLFDTFRVLHPSDPNARTAHGFSGGIVGDKIDYIFMPTNKDILGARIVHYNVSGRYPSDHYPVVATVKMQPY